MVTATISDHKLLKVSVNKNKPSEPLNTLLLNIKTLSHGLQSKNELNTL